MPINKKIKSDVQRIADLETAVKKSLQLVMEQTRLIQTIQLTQAQGKPLTGALQQHACVMSDLVKQIESLLPPT